MITPYGNFLLISPGDFISYLALVNLMSPFITIASILVIVSAFGVTAVSLSFASAQGPPTGMFGNPNDFRPGPPIPSCNADFHQGPPNDEISGCRETP